MCFNRGRRHQTWRAACTMKRGVKVAVYHASYVATSSCALSSASQRRIIRACPTHDSTHAMAKKAICKGLRVSSACPTR
jgi:hypothetical protein